MALDASSVLGSAQLAGVKVNPCGYAWSLTRSQAGGLATRITLGRPPASGPAQTPRFGRLAFLAVTGSELALVKLKSSNGVTVKPSEVIARMPRGDLNTVEYHRGYVSPLTIEFRNGDMWRLEVPALNGKHGEAVVRVLNG